MKCNEPSRMMKLEF